VKVIYVGGFHKTGLNVMKFLFEKYQISFGNELFEAKIKEKWNNLSIRKLAAHKSVVCIRNPYEVIVSGMRYHQITMEPWCKRVTPELNNKSYKEVIKNLPNIEEKIKFEMNHKSRKTILNMYEFVKSAKQFIITSKDDQSYNINNNILFIKLEDFWVEKTRDNIVDKTCNHLNFLNKHKFKKVIEHVGTRKHNATHNQFSYTYKELFTEDLYEEFDKLFPADILEVLDYEK